MAATMTKSDLAAEVAELRRELADLRKQLATEVRTRRLVVLDREGREAVYTHECEDAMQLVVAWPAHGGDEDQVTQVEMTAGDETSDAFGSGAGSFAVSMAGELALVLGARSEGFGDGAYARQEVETSLSLDRKSRGRRADGRPEVVWDRARTVEVDASGLELRSAGGIVRAEAVMQIVPSR